KAEESDRLKTSFLNNLNHEIRTPLNAIVGFSDLLFEDYSEDQKKDFVETINNNADQLLRIIDDVLAVSRLDSEKIPLEPECFYPQSLLQSLFTTFNSLINTKLVSFHLDELPQSFAGELCADKGKIRQVLSGFISNSLKYTEQGSIHFGFQHINNHLRFYVKDTGIGIPEEEQVQVFNRFFRGYEPQIRAIRGNGLGLSIANGLVELMGSRIQLISESGVGSTFFFDIEIKEPSCNPKQILEPQLKHPIAISRLSVLVVEDEIDNFSYLEAILSGKVEKIVHARTGLEAIRILRTQQFDLILMDIKMPKMDGYEATKIIVSEFPYIPIIAQTAFSQPEEINRAKNAGCYDCLVKPIEKNKLFVVLNQLFGDNTVNS
ncbi:MAG: response regulator, partial [Ignavibacteria bacterium]|nr:response regulator [Ignavibacteria bacterium]